MKSWPNFLHLVKPRMNKKSIVLMAGAVAAGMNAASQKSTNPTVTMIMIFAAVSLSFFADPPRDPDSHDRVHYKLTPEEKAGEEKADEPTGRNEP